MLLRSAKHKQVIFFKKIKFLSKKLLKITGHKELSALGRKEHHPTQHGWFLAVLLCVCTQFQSCSWIYFCKKDFKLPLIQPSTGKLQFENERDMGLFMDSSLWRIMEQVRPSGQGIVPLPCCPSWSVPSPPSHRCPRPHQSVTWAVGWIGKGTPCPRSVFTVFKLFEALGSGGLDLTNGKK